MDALQADLEIVTFLKAKRFQEQYEKAHNLNFTNLSRKKDDSILPEAREFVKSLRDGIKKDINKLADDYFALSMGTIEEQMKEIAKIEKTLIDAVLLFSDKFEAKKREKNILDFHIMEI